MDEIPTALREAESQPESPSLLSNLVIVLLSIIGTVGIFLFYYLTRSGEQIQVNSEISSAQTLTKTELGAIATDTVANSPISSTSASSGTSTGDVEIKENALSSTEIVAELQPENVLGHLPYEEAPLAELEPITNDGRIRLRKKAAERFLAMQADARQNGILLTPLSGFRSVAEQEHLFFGIKEQRKQVVAKRAEVSAPPGYSEHHTGYVVDIGDGRAPATNLSPRFNRTAAYQWLANNAARYSFELSFTPNNHQGISYEPWHWRYVGDTDSLETFYKARNLTTKLN